MPRRSVVLAILVLFLGLRVARVAAGADAPASAAPAAGAPQEGVVFVVGDGGPYKSYRIPAILATTKGTLLAFCEGRVAGASDNGNIDTVLRRSTDGGATWGPVQLIADVGDDYIGNPCPVLDRTTGRVWLPLIKKAGENSGTQNKRGTGRGTMEVFMLYSDDDGATWSKPQDVTAQFKRPDMTWYVTGPGVGIQLADGRLVIPCDHRTPKVRGDKSSLSHVVYSDDHGKTWHVGGISEAKTNECQVAELDDGTLLLNMRSHHGKNRRAVATSADRGLTWSKVTLDDNLIDPTCQASLIRVPTAADPKRSVLLFSNPAGDVRANMTVRLSRDGGKTWPLAGVLHAGQSAYSSLVALPGGRAGCLFEKGDGKVGRKDEYKQIVFTRFALDWLRPSAPAPGPAPAAAAPDRAPN
ncbi:MAG TPA: sialidase family protein [Tepidisphaeraceae bacterium]|nr:sialidase family protein [Tepidisphaeraceae bacterium]